ncbi:MAG: tetratricopeptide repeat protein, partial [Bacteriovoracaceae bacterium]
MKIYLRANLLFILLLLVSCDFTPTYHKEILKAQDYVKEQNYNKAVLQYENLLKKTISNEIKIKIYFQLGEIYSIHLGKIKKSLDYYKSVTKISDDIFWTVKAEEKIANLSLDFLKDFNRSQKSFEKLSQFVPRLDKYETFLFKLGYSHFKLNNFEESKSVFKKLNAVENSDYFVKSSYYLGLINYLQKNWRESILYWKKYISMEKRRDQVVKTIFLMDNAYETMEELKSAYNLYYSTLVQDDSIPDSECHV